MYLTNFESVPCGNAAWNKIIVKYEQIGSEWYQLFQACSSTMVETGRYSQQSSRVHARFCKPVPVLDAASFHLALEYRQGRGAHRSDGPIDVKLVSEQTSGHFPICKCPSMYRDPGPQL